MSLGAPDHLGAGQVRSPRDLQSPEKKGGLLNTTTRRDGAGRLPHLPNHRPWAGPLRSLPIPRRAEAPPRVARRRGAGPTPGTMKEGNGRMPAPLSHRDVVAGSRGKGPRREGLREGVSPPVRLHWRPLPTGCPVGGSPRHPVPLSWNEPPTLTSPVRQGPACGERSRRLSGRDRRLPPTGRLLCGLHRRPVPIPDKGRLAQD